MQSPWVFDVDLPEFEQRVIDASHEQAMIVDLWAEWCPPCLAISPILEQAVQEYDGEVLLAKVEVDKDDNMKIAGRFQARGFPTILLLRNGEEQGRFSSARPLSYVLEFIDQYKDG